MITPTIKDVQAICGELANKLESTDVEFIVGVSRGGLIPAALVATRLVKPLVTAYIDKQDQVYLDRTEWLKDKHVVVIDDAVRTGKTMNKIVDLVIAAGPASLKAMVMYAHPKSEISTIHFKETEELVKFPWDVDISQ
jgi:adenine/guanine phosphoribosyltransferase-like PRPP-binding protein